MRFINKSFFNIAESKTVTDSITIDGVEYTVKMIVDSRADRRVVQANTILATRFFLDNGYTHSWVKEISYVDKVVVL